MSHLVILNSISAGYDDEIILRNVNLTINENDFIGVIGPNGGGKTTLVKVILGILKPMKGSIEYASNEPGKTLIGYLPQINQIDKKFPISVSEVVISGLMSAGIKRYHFSSTYKSIVNDLLEKMGVYSLRKKPIGELSGGQMQRVLLCRSLISSPRLLILDEPNTFVDNKFENDLYETLAELNKKMAILLITHDVGTISYYVKTIACVNTFLHYHNSNIITEQQLAAYNCPIQIITHGDVPHTVLKTHNHQEE
jgi:zinc transport system ATP-binding protein